MMEIVEKNLGKLCCKYCIMFKENKCSGEDSTYHEDEKEMLVEISMDKYEQSGNAYNKHWAENINDYYLCEEFDDGQINK